MRQWNAPFFQGRFELVTEIEKIKALEKAKEPREIEKFLESPTSVIEVCQATIEPTL
jgi:hypothetical protein